MGFLIRVVINAFSIWVVTLIPALGIQVVPFSPGGELQLVISLLVIAAIFAVVNAVVGRVLKVLTFLLYILTLGLFSLVVNGILLWLTAWITGFWSWGLRVDSFWWGVIAALLISVINWVFGLILRPRRDRLSRPRDR